MRNHNLSIILLKKNIFDFTSLSTLVYGEEKRCSLEIELAVHCVPNLPIYYWEKGTVRLWKGFSDDPNKTKNRQPQRSHTWEAKRSYGCPFRGWQGLDQEVEWREIPRLRDFKEDKLMRFSEWFKVFGVRKPRGELNM